MKNSLIINPLTKIKEALKQLDKVGQKTLIVSDDEIHLLGTLSDGDLRRAILQGKTLRDSICDIYQKNSKSLVEGKYTQKDVENLFIKNKFDLIPVLNEKSQIIDILFWDSVLSDKKTLTKQLNVPVVIMAGGRGTRMEPFTKVLPKPLIPVYEKPIIEHIIERFNKIGCDDFHLTVNYKSKILKAYFEELQPNYQVSFVDESEPLGTAGSLRYLDSSFSEPFFVTNCDIIIKSDYVSLYEFHKKGNYDITLVASTKEYIIPYGSCEINNEGHLAHINEKPKYDFLINTGLYVISPEVLKLIPEDTFYHITHLIEDAKNTGKKVGVFPIDDDSWIDVGQWAEYRNSLNKF
tara:strand:+ start:1513 stop:2562 length:1050 start_codon:yes stop_codon:yes gene_type:complete